MSFITISFTMVNEYENTHSGYGHAPGYGTPESGYGPSGFEDTPENGTPNTGLGAGHNPWRTRIFADGYRGNPFEVNPFDTPWTETAANPIPQGEGYGSSPDRQVAEDEWPPSLRPKPQGVVNAEAGPSPLGRVPKRRSRQRTYGDDQLML